MVFSRSCLRLETSFRSRSVTSCSQLLITKKTVYFDYVGIDVSGLVGNALRLAKNNANEQRRQREVGRHVLHSVQQLLRKINCKKSLLIAMDGAESLAKACATRRGTLTRRLESRLVRLPGTPLMQTVEECLVRMMPENQLRLLPSEVVISGTGVTGCVEEKFSAWALDLACREGFNANQDSLCLIGSSDLFLNALAMTPYYDIRSVVQGTSDMKQMTMSSLLEWLELDEFATKGDSTLVARARTDALFLYLISSGCTATELPSASNARFTVFWDRYHTRSFQRSSNDESLTGAKSIQSSGSKDKNASFYLFTDTPDHRLELDVENFLEILGLVSANALPEGVRSDNRATPKGNAMPHKPHHPSTSVSLTGAGTDMAAGGYLEHALQSHAMLCLGYTSDPFHVPHPYDGIGDAQERSVPINRLALHLKALLAQGVRKLRAKDPSVNRRALDREFLDRSSLQPVSPSTSPAQDRTKQGDISKETTVSIAPSPSVEDEGRESGKACRVSESGSSSTPSFPTDVDPDNPFWSPMQPLTAAEYTLLCQVQTANIESNLQLYVGMIPKPDLAKQILRTTDIYAAHRLVQEALSYADPERPHKCLCLSPSYCWLQSDKTKLWRMEYVDIGALAREQGIRRVRNAISGMTMELRASEGGSARFDFNTQLWQPILRFPCGGEEKIPDVTEVVGTAAASAEGEAAVGDSARTPAADTSDDLRESPPSGKTVKVLTWNVMFDRYSGQPTPLGMPGIDWCSPQRYPVLAKCIAAEDADVVGMQEVEPAFLRYLAAQKWCREDYILSCTETSPVIHPWGVAMLIHRRRLPVLELTHVNVPAWSGHVSLMPVVTLRLGGVPVQISAVHLLAPFTKAHENARTTQDLALRQRLVKNVPPNGDCIAMGDFNDYPGNEFLMPNETQYLECWPMLHPQDPGKTMDDTNTFCKLKVEEMFFGRSDKIFLRGRRLMPIEAHLVGTKSVNTENGDDAAPSYLFPSDHYGVSMTFTLKSAP